MKQNISQEGIQQSKQRPIGSGFSAHSTAEDVVNGIDLSGITAIVTGGTTGIGRETVRVLAAAGATVVVPARDLNKAIANLQGIPSVEIEFMDLMVPASIDAFTTRFLASGRPLHLLINNAGIMWVPLRRNSDGIESQLATNYLAAFQLTARLLPALEKAGTSRVVNVSSLGHQFAPFDFGDPNFEARAYETLQAYGQSKTAINLFTVALDQKLAPRGIRAYALNPGAIADTELAREAPPELFVQMGIMDADGNLNPEVAASLKSIPQGAATTVWCATSTLLAEKGGVYCEDCDIAPIVNEPANQGVMAYAVDPDLAEKLWNWTEARTGIRFETSLSILQS